MGDDALDGAAHNLLVGHRQVTRDNQSAIAAHDWSHAYTREQAAFPLPFVRANKHWPAVGRIDNPYGDRNLMCSCPPVAEYV